VPLTDLIATFDFTGASVTVDGVAQESGVTANDFTQALAYTVTPASGDPVTYTVTAVTGTLGLMGGVIQGSPLALAGAVTTVAGQASKFGSPAGIVRVGSALYVADSQFNVIWKIEISSGAVTLVAGILGEQGYANNTVGTGALFNYPVGLATDNTTTPSSIYVADQGNNRIRRIDISSPSAPVTTIAGTGSAGTADGLPGVATFDAPAGLFCSGSTLFETDFNSGSLRTIDLTAGPSYGNVVTRIAAFTWANPSGIAYDGSRYLYVADQSSNTIYQVDTASAYAATAYAGGNAMGAWSDGVGASAQFSGPQGLWYRSGTLYIADTGNHVIRTISGLPAANQAVSTYLGNAEQSGSSDGTGSGTAMKFNLPVAVAMSASTPLVLYVTDGGNLAVRSVQLSPIISSSTIAGTPPGNRDGTGTAARFNVPRMLGTNGSTLWIDDEYNQTFRAMDIATGAVSTIVGQLGVAGNGNGTGTGAQLNFPYGVTTDGKSLFICDTYGMTIRRVVLSTMVVTTFAGSPNQSGFADGIGSAARFNRPTGITTDGTSLYVADYLNHAIRRIDIATATVKTIAGSPPPAAVFGDADDATATGGISTASRLRRPIDITTDGTSLYVTDNVYGKVRRIIIATGKVSTLAGPAPGTTTTGYVNGTGNAARFLSPIGITTDGTSLYVADDANGAIRKIVIATGVVTTLAGPDPSAFYKYGEIDGTGSAARFNGPFGITTDGIGLFVTDNMSHVVRRIR
jgi:sugar lactone lactonase YvrE